MTTNYDELKPLIRNILLSLGRVATKHEFCCEYMNFEGESFQTSVLDKFNVGFWSFMKKIPDVCRLDERRGTIERVANEKTEHMNKLTINKGKRNNRPRFNVGGSSYRSVNDRYQRPALRIQTYTPPRKWAPKDLREKLLKKSSTPSERPKLQKTPFRQPSRFSASSRSAKMPHRHAAYLVKPTSSGLLPPHMLKPTIVYKPVEEPNVIQARQSTGESCQPAAKIPPHLAKLPPSGLLPPHMLEPLFVYKPVEEPIGIQVHEAASQTTESCQLAQQRNATDQLQTSMERFKHFHDSWPQIDSGPGKENIAENLLDGYITKPHEIPNLAVNADSPHNLFTVKVIHCAHPSQFIFQFDCDDFYSLLNEMNAHYSHETLKPLIVTVPIIGLPVAVLVDDSWTRGSIVDEAGAAAKIHLVDLGCDRVISFDSLFFLKKSFAKYHRMTEVGCLHGVKPEGEFWSQLTIDTFKMSVYKWKCVADIKKAHNEYYELILINDIEDFNNYNNINKFMIDQRLAVSSK